ncbi:hypothetical protein [Rubellimicrobium aerolatum]|uniref:Uncharacterized protein n=1 Tax=Rubellimicrobium aerolatum TaxID=490979 RepID=A0ABW0SH20_9RHOB|nr:hypothetical protein [Rubellimicrobium aerolatum]MBP1807582.1 hypothetical protein [Rubellimicrobium aerolatum]
MDGTVVPSAVRADGNLPEDGLLRVRKLLTAIDHELRAAGANVEGIQDALSPALSLAVLDHPEAVAGLQELDHLAQTLHALADVVLSLSDVVDPAHAVAPHVLDAVRLGKLASRLRDLSDGA